MHGGEAHEMPRQGSHLHNQIYPLLYRQDLHDEYKLWNTRWERELRERQANKGDSE